MRFLTVQLKVTLLVFVVLVATLGGVIWKTQALLIEDKIDFITDSSMKQIAPLKRLVQQRVGDDKARLVRFAGVRMKEGPGRARGFGDFSVIAMIQPSARTGEKAGWTPAWVEMNAASDSTARSGVATWPKNHEITLLKSLPYNRLRDGELIWVRMSDPTGAPVYAMLMSIDIQHDKQQAREAAEATLSLPDTADETMSLGGVRKAILVGLTSVDTLASVTEDFIGSSNTVFLVDDRGYVASHVNKAHLGALFTEDPLVQEIIRSRKSASSGRFEDIESREVFAHYERIDRTNLYAVITTPEKAVSAVLASYRNTALATGAGIGILGLLLAFFGSRSLLSGAATEAKFADDTDEEADDAPIASVEPAPVAVQTAKESIEIEIFSDGFVEALSEPLHAVLGHAHLIKAKTQEEEIVSHAEGIERESRRVREVIERMREFQSEYFRGADSAEPADPVEAVQEALEKLESRLDDEDILVVRDLCPVPLIEVPSARLAKAVVNVIENSIEAMQARPTKHLKIELRPDGDDHVTLTISDTGVGMPRAVANRALEPFFKDFDSPQRMGLGLSYVAAAVKLIGGSCSIQSQPGDGASVTLKFPVSVAEQAAYREREARELAAAVQTVEAARHVSEELVATGESVVSAGSLAHADDDDDEIFANVALGQAASSLSFIEDESGDTADDETDDETDDVKFTPAIFAETIKAEPEPEDKEILVSPEFQVKVRKPRMKNLR
jgi:signal transduction histidine kinase